MKACSQTSVAPPSRIILPVAFKGIEGLIGNTPLIAIRASVRGKRRTIHAKLEYFNFSGSMKDRMALAILEAAYIRGALRPGDTIVEASSGCAGIAFAALGRAMGHSVRIYMPDWMSVERVQLLRSYGAQVRLVSKEEGGFLGAMARARHDGEETGVFLPCQFDCPENSGAHFTGTGPEILQQLGRAADCFVAGVGTGGTIMGVGRALRAVNADTRIHPVEPAESPTLSIGRKVGSHRIQGFTDAFVPSLLDLAALDPVIGVSDGDSIIMAQRLGAELGLGVGVSSGANFLAALKASRTGETVVTIFCDDSKKYLSTDYGRVEPVRGGYLSTEVVLHDFEVIRH